MAAANWGVEEIWAPAEAAWSSDQVVPRCSRNRAHSDFSGLFPSPLHSWHFPDPSHTRQVTRLREPVELVRVPTPSHIAQKPEPLQNGQGFVSSSVVMTSAFGCLHA